MSRILKWAAMLGALGGVALAETSATAAEAEAVFQIWTQLQPDVTAPAQVRAITSANQCPAYALDADCTAGFGDGAPAQTMSLRAEADARFPVRTCQADLPAGTSRVSVKDGAQCRTLTLPSWLAQTTPAKPEDILVIGDTGCRVNYGIIQDCNENSAAGYPFKRLADFAVGTEPKTGAPANPEPELIIHVGDYLYREQACKEPAKCDCDGAPCWGNTWPAWQADFFTPAATLLPTAPWVFTRGNHESCARGFRGWFRFFDVTINPAAGQGPAALPADTAACDSAYGVTKPFALTLGRLTLVVADTGDLDGFVPNATPVPATTEHTWLITHVPAWSAAKFEGCMSKVTSRTVKALVDRQTRGKPVDLVLSGHTHLFEALFPGDADGNAVTQLIVGNSGTKLGSCASTDPLIEDRFGFMKMRAGPAAASGWDLTVWWLEADDTFTATLCSYCASGAGDACTSGCE